MRRIKPTSKYQTVSFPQPLYDEIKDFVINHEKYRSIAEFVKEATREKMNEGNITNLDIAKNVTLEIDSMVEWEKMKRLHDEIKRKIMEKKNVAESYLCSKCKKKQEEMRELIINEYICQAELGDKNAIVKLSMMMSKEGKFIKKMV